METISFFFFFCVFFFFPFLLNAVKNKKYVLLNTHTHMPPAQKKGKHLMGRGAWDKVKTGLKIAGTVAEHVLLPPKKTRFYLGPNGLETEEKYDWNDAGWKARQERGMRQRMRENERKWYGSSNMSGNGFWDKVKKVAKVALPAVGTAAVLAGAHGAYQKANAKPPEWAGHSLWSNVNASWSPARSLIRDHGGDGLKKRGGQRRQKGGALPAFLLPAVSYLAPAATAYAKGLLVSAIMHAIQTTMNLSNFEPGEWMAYLKYQLRQLFTTKFLIDGPLQQYIGQKVQQMVYGLPPDLRAIAAQTVKEELAAAAAATKARRAARFSKLEPGQVPGLNGPVNFVPAAAAGP
jgi:hypothetical protein